MTIESIRHLGWYSGGALLLLMTLIQISPIKVNPWSWIGRCIGRAINGEVLEKVETLTLDVKRNKAEDEVQWVSLSRTHILRFGDELLHGVTHSKEHFDQVLDDIKKYENYCKDHQDYPNGKAVATIKQIKKTYQKCLDENNFL